MSRIANLRDERNFPIFISCPHDKSIELDYFKLIGNCLWPKRHWCLLAEIVETSCFFRPRLLVTDKSGTTLPIAFHLQNNLTPQAWQDFRPGLSVAVLYPQQHVFQDSTVGIKQEMPDGVQVGGSAPPTPKETS